MSVIDTNFPEVMTKQEIFDHAAPFLIKQNKCSRKGSFSTACVYRSQDNMACAVGCLIRDDEYKPEMDNALNSSIEKMINMMPARLQPHLEFLVDLQYVHDKTDPEEWKQKLQKLAKKHSLNSSVID